MGKKKSWSLERAQYINAYTWSVWFNRFYDLAISSISWENLPLHIPPEFIERVLFFDGKIIFFNDPAMGLTALPFTSDGVPNVYGYPTTRRAYSVGNPYTVGGLTDENSVICYNNNSKTNAVDDIIVASQKLTDIDRSIEVNVRAQKTPVVIVADDDSQKLTYINAWEQYDGNKPVLFLRNSFNLDKFNVQIPTQEYKADKLNTLKRQIFEETLTYMGIEANTNEKSERMITNEIQSNLGATEAFRQSRLMARQNAVEKINLIFGTDIKVKFNSNLFLSKLGGEENGDLYNETKDDM